MKLQSQPVNIKIKEGLSLGIVTSINPPMKLDCICCTQQSNIFIKSTFWGVGKIVRDVFLETMVDVFMNIVCCWFMETGHFFVYIVCWLMGIV